MLDKELLEILACPKCKGAVKLSEEDTLVCERCRLIYKIRNDVPVMLVDEARPLD